MGDSSVDGVLDFMVAWRVNPQNWSKGPFHGTFTLMTSEGVTWEGNAVSPVDDDPAVWNFMGHGVGSITGKRLKLTLTFVNYDTSVGTVTGQVVGK